MPKILLNAQYNAVEVDSVRSGKFVISPLPTMIGTLEDAVMFANRSPGWRLPDLPQCRCMARHLRRINNVLRENRLPLISRRSLLWTDTYFHTDSFLSPPSVVCVFMASRSIYEEWGGDRHEFRLVAPLIQEEDSHGAQG